MPNILVMHENQNIRGLLAVLENQRHFNIYCLKYSRLGDGLENKELFSTVFLCVGPGSISSGYIDLIEKSYGASNFIIVTNRLEDDIIYLGKKLRASAYVDYNASQDQLALAMKSASNGGLYISSGLACETSAAALLVEEPVYGVPAISARELEVLKLVAKGMSNKSIGRELFITEKTVKNHIYNIFKKLGVKDRTEAAMVAFKGTALYGNESLDPKQIDSR